NRDARPKPWPKCFFQSRLGPLTRALRRGERANSIRAQSPDRHGNAQIFYSQFLHKLERQIYTSSGDFANGAGNFSVFPVIRFALRIWIYGGSFFPPFRYSNIIGNTVALLNRLFEILSAKEVAEERRRSIRYADD